MLAAVLANRPMAPSSLLPSVFKACRGILKGFHEKKNDFQMQATLCELWRPVLWRHFNVANALPRRNATELLHDAFPVEDPGWSIEEKDAERMKQLEVI